MRLDGLCMTASWADRPATLGAFVDATAGYLSALRPLHPLLRGPMVLLGASRQEVEPLAPDASNLAGFVQRVGWNRKAPAGWHTGVRPDRTMSLDGTSVVGFEVLLCTSGAQATPEAMSLRIAGGKTGSVPVAGLTMEFPGAGAPEFAQAAFVRRLIGVTVERWQPEFLQVFDEQFRKAVEARASEPAGIVGWMNYFDDRAVERALPIEVARGRLGAGVLATLQPEPPGADNEAAIEQALALRRALLSGRWFTSRADRTASGAPA